MQAAFWIFIPTQIVKFSAVRLQARSFFNTVTALLEMTGGVRNYKEDTNATV